MGPDASDGPAVCRLHAEAEEDGRDSWGDADFAVAVVGGEPVDAAPLIMSFTRCMSYCEAEMPRMCVCVCVCEAVMKFTWVRTDGGVRAAT
jgi:hypothetical protein